MSPSELELPAVHAVEILDSRGNPTLNPELPYRKVNRGYVAGRSVSSWVENVGAGLSAIHIAASGCRSGGHPWLRISSYRRLPG